MCKVVGAGDAPSHGMCVISWREEMMNANIIGLPIFGDGRITKAGGLLHS